MIKNTRFISDLNQFLETVSNLLRIDTDCDIMISGTFDNLVYKDILDRTLVSSNSKNCRIIIPYVTSNGAISRPYINKLSIKGGQVRINSRFKKSLLVIGEYAFVLSFSSNYSKVHGFNTRFEYCVVIDCSKTVEEIQKEFMNAWQESLPLSMSES